jgi:hypothetical protein
MAKKKRRRRRRVKKGAKRRQFRRPSGAGDNAVASYLMAAHQSLLDERADVDRKITALESALAQFRHPALGKRGPGRPAARPAGGYRAGSLKDYILRVLSGGRTAAVKDIADGVVRAGYQSRNKTLAKSVGIALAQMPEVAKMGRGQYRLA